MDGFCPTNIWNIWRKLMNMGDWAIEPSAKYQWNMGNMADIIGFNHPKNGGVGCFDWGTHHWQSIQRSIRLIYVSYLFVLVCDWVDILIYDLHTNDLHTNMVDILTDMYIILYICYTYYVFVWYSHINKTYIFWYSSGFKTLINEASWSGDPVSVGLGLTEVLDWPHHRSEWSVMVRK